jgi:uncharacterized membrane protein YedE/YeeE
MPIFATFVSGLVFGLGLCVSGLANPAKVLSFLDVAGSWDPSLALTMASAVLVTGLGYRLAFARERPLFMGSFQLPPAGAADRRLVAGAAIFGIGWGLAGFCPGPALVALSLGSMPATVFVTAMIAGMALARRITAFPMAPASKAADALSTQTTRRFQ